MAAFVWASWLGTALTALVRLYQNREALCARPALSEARRLLAFGARLHGAALLAVLLAVADRFVVVTFWDDTSLGLYVVALTLATAGLSLVTGAFNVLLLPRLVLARDVAAQRRIMGETLRYVSLLLTVGTAVLLLLCPWLLPFLFGDAYAGAIGLCLVLLLAYLPTALRQVIVHGLCGTGDWRPRILAEGLALGAFAALVWPLAAPAGPARHPDRPARRRRHRAGVPARLPAPPPAAVLARVLGPEPHDRQARLVARPRAAEGQPERCAQRCIGKWSGRIRLHRRLRRGPTRGRCVRERTALDSASSSSPMRRSPSRPSATAAPSGWWRCCAQGLAARGHQVTLMAAKGSRDYGRLITHPWAGARPYPYRAWCKVRFQALSLWHTRHADVVINFGRVDYLWSLLKTTTPLICQFQNPIEHSEIEFLVSRRAEALVFVSVSDHQRAHLAGTGSWRTIYNAVDTDRLAFAPRPDPGYLAFLGRLTANKGVHIAIEVAKKLGRPLRIAGNVSDEAGGREYFETRVRPQLGDGIEWVGPVDDAAKVPFLQNAAALLVPIQWDEPFGLVVAEALACGTPVIAMLRGSMPELIRHGVTAFSVGARTR